MRRLAASDGQTLAVVVVAVVFGGLVAAAVPAYLGFRTARRRRSPKSTCLPLSGRRRRTDRITVHTPAWMQLTCSRSTHAFRRPWPLHLQSAAATASRTACAEEVGASRAPLGETPDSWRAPPAPDSYAQPGRPRRPAAVRCAGLSPYRDMCWSPRRQQDRSSYLAAAAALHVVPFETLCSAHGPAPAPPVSGFDSSLPERAGTGSAPLWRATAVLQLVGSRPSRSDTQRSRTRPFCFFEFLQTERRQGRRPRTPAGGRCSRAAVTRLGSASVM